MIVSFGDRATEALFHGTRHKGLTKLPIEVRRVGPRKLDMLNAAAEFGDLRSPPGNRLEALRGDMAGLHSIRINDQWRIVFRWTQSGPAEVAIVDYH